MNVFEHKRYSFEHLESCEAHCNLIERLFCPQVQNLQGQLRQTGQGLYGQAQGMAQGLQGQLMQQGQGLYSQAQRMGGGLQSQLMQQGQNLYGQAQSMGQGAFQQGMNLGSQLQQQGQNAFRQGAGMAQGLQGAFFSEIKFKKNSLLGYHPWSRKKLLLKRNSRRREWSLRDL